MWFFVGPINPKSVTWVPERLLPFSPVQTPLNGERELGWGAQRIFGDTYMKRKSLGGIPGTRRYKPLQNPNLYRIFMLGAARILIL
jgi:hypothetical protein